MRLIDLTGETFGFFLVLGRADDHEFPCGARRPRWRVQCSCGVVTTALGTGLRRGSTTSCGCQDKVQDHRGRRLKEIPGYVAAHDRVRKARGLAKEHRCVDCGEPAREWSYDNSDPNELTESFRGTVLGYSLDANHYDPRCGRCHRAFDAVRHMAARTHCKHGHEYTPENTRMAGRGRQCRACHRRYSAAHKARQRAVGDVSFVLAEAVCDVA